MCMQTHGLKSNSLQDCLAFHWPLSPPCSSFLACVFALACTCKRMHGNPRAVTPPACLSPSLLPLRPNPRLARALEIMFVLHMEHEMNCSTAAARHLASRWEKAAAAAWFVFATCHLHTHSGWARFNSAPPTPRSPAPCRRILTH